MDIEGLKYKVRLTRISRIKAEKRLLSKESFVQWMNIYYSCVTIIFSIIACIHHNDELSELTLFMSIILLVFILYLNGQNYSNRAIKFRENYTSLQSLELELECMAKDDKEKYCEIQKKYIELLNISENHISFDYYCAIYGERVKGRIHDDILMITRRYRWGTLWRVMLKSSIVIIPILLFVFVNFN